MPGRHCAVAACRNSWQKTKLTDKNILYHAFPSGKDSISQQIKMEWIQRCSRIGNWNPTNSQVCSIHFEDDAYKRDLQHELLKIPVRKRLKKTAIPTLHLGKSEESSIAKSTITVKQERNNRQLRRTEKEIFAEILRDKAEIQAAEPAPQPEENWEEKYIELSKAFDELQEKQENLTEGVKHVTKQLTAFIHQQETKPVELVQCLHKLLTLMSIKCDIIKNVEQKGIKRKRQSSSGKAAKKLIKVKLKNIPKNFL